MAGPLKQEHIAAGLFSHWADRFPLAVTTVYPGTRVETGGLAEWVELWLDVIAGRPQRPARPVGDLSVTAHCFVKPGLDKARVHELADAARLTLENQTIEIRDQALSGTPVTGYAILFEGETRELTRGHLERGQHALQHVAVTCAGLVQGTG